MEVGEVGEVVPDWGGERGEGKAMTAVRSARVSMRIEGVGVLVVKGLAVRRGGELRVVRLRLSRVAARDFA